MQDRKKLLVIAASALGAIVLIIILYQVFFSGPSKRNTVGVPGGVTVEPVPPEQGGSRRVMPPGG